MLSFERHEQNQTTLQKHTTIDPLKWVQHWDANRIPKSAKLTEDKGTRVIKQCNIPHESILAWDEKLIIIILGGMKLKVWNS